MWETVEPQVSHVNAVLQKNRSNIKPLICREQSHSKQPFHDLPPHLSLSMNSNMEELKQFMRQAGDDTIELTFDIGVVKLIPPTMNGSLSVVMEIQFDDETKEKVDSFRRILNSEHRLHAWQHITIGQSFYEPDVANVISQLNKEHKVNIACASVEDVEKTQLKGGKMAKETVEKQSEYFIQELLPYLAKKRYEIGQFRGNDDHVILSSRHKKRLAKVRFLRMVKKMNVFEYLFLCDWSVFYYI